MLTHNDIGEHKKAVIFGLDDVLFPQRDYLIQVYYLFANLLEYTETVPPADDLVKFLKTAYERHGPAGIFERAAEVFGIDGKYKTSFDRLHYTAQLPLELLLYKPMQELMQALNDSGKQLLILTEGNPAIQLNKLKQMSWGGLDRMIKVYFREELITKGYNPIDFVLDDNRLKVVDIVYIGHAETDILPTAGRGIDRLDVTRFLESLIEQNTAPQ